VDVRLIAATNRDLNAEMESGRFRPDLYHRLAVYPIHVPALRDHRDDIPMLSAHFLDVSRQRLGLGRVRLAEDARERLMALDWPGNVRELENVISRGVLRAARGATGRGRAILVGAEHLDLGTGLSAAVPEMAGDDDAQPENLQLSLAERVDAFRRRAILQAVKRHHGNWAAAARELGLHRSNLHQLAARLGLRDRRGR
jgi:anaerobic nitric oxide reductase transcription regulator